MYLQPEVSWKKYKGRNYEQFSCSIASFVACCMPMYRWATSNFSGDAGQQYVRSRAQKFIR
jgi:hypothetical protein